MANLDTPKKCITPTQAYSLGLGKLFPDLGNDKKKQLSPSEKDELIFIQREKEKESESIVNEQKRKAPIYKKGLVCKGECTKTIRELYTECDKFASERENTKLPEITTARNAYNTVQHPMLTASNSIEKLSLLKNSRLHGKLVTAPQTRKMAQSMELTQFRSNGLDKIEKRESVHEFIRQSRTMLLAKLMMEDKKKEAERMNEYIERKEAVLKLNKEIYEQDKKMVNDYVEYMKDQAEEQKNKADKMASIRQQKEAELEELTRKRLTLKKKIGDDKEECRTLLEHKKFIFSLVPDLKEEIEKRKKKRKGIFLTQNKETENQSKESKNVTPILSPTLNDPNSQNTQNEQNELRDELELSENDSDTEIPPGFSSVSEMLNRMTKIESKNLALIQESQKREEVLEWTRKEYAAKIEEKTILLKRVQQEIAEMQAEERRKLSFLKDISHENTANTDPSKTKMTLKSKSDDLIHEMEVLVRQIYKECCGNTETRIDKDDFSCDATLELLGLLTSHLMDLKEYRTYKIKNAERTAKIGSTEVLKREEVEWKKYHEKLADKARHQAEAEELNKKLEAQMRKNRPRVKKNAKEFITKYLLNPMGNRKKEVKIEKVDNTFDDKYFAD